MEILMYFLWLIVVAYIILTIDSIRYRTPYESICRTVNYHSAIITYRGFNQIKFSFDDISFGVGELNSSIYRTVSSSIEWIYLLLLECYLRGNGLKCELIEKFNDIFGRSIEYIYGIIHFPQFKFIDKLYDLNMHKKRFDYYERLIAFRSNLYYNTPYASKYMDRLISNKLKHKESFNKEKFWWMKRI